jgi:hypothetical protein
LERSISNLWDVDNIFRVYACRSIEGRTHTLIRLTFGRCCKKEMKNKLNIWKKVIPGACHLPRILGPVNERFRAFIDFFHAAFRSCSNLILVKGLAKRRLTDGDADGWGALGNSLGQSTQKKPLLLRRNCLKDDLRHWRHWRLTQKSQDD